MAGRRGRGRVTPALAISVGLHAVALGLAWYSVSGAAPAPHPRVFRVDIVSPPPNRLGEPAPSPPTSGTTTPEPEPEAAQPPSGEPIPTPPSEAKPAAREEPPPAPAPAPVKPPEPQPKKEPPKTAPPRHAEAVADKPKSTPSSTTRRSDRPQETAVKAGPKKGAGPAGRTEIPATGRNPDPSSPGGEGLNVRTAGAEFVDPTYLANIIRQLKRYFRPPPGARSDEAEVRFYINRDGTVSDIAVVRSKGAFPFRAAAMEAVEQAGISRAFGPLPRAYPGTRLPVSFTFEPAS
ncbi:MAG: TonB family protein [Gemmatimonadetes bacterium]|nr:TonB family protein [Gemmatimonadota bacterium]